jgi:hypothetical protein
MEVKPAIPKRRQAIRSQHGSCGRRLYNNMFSADIICFFVAKNGENQLLGNECDPVEYEK